MKIPLTFLLFILTIKFTHSQHYQEFYVEDVEVIEYLTVNFCVDNKGKTSTVTIIPEKTTYTNQENINQVIEYRKSIEYYPDSKLCNKCHDYTFRFINSQYESKKLPKSEYAKCKTFQTGKFKYSNIINPNTVIERTNQRQIEKTDGEINEYKIEWISPFEYKLTYLKVSKKENQYNIGNSIKVEIVDVLGNGKYFYRANLMDRTFTSGIIEKIE